MSSYSSVLAGIDENDDMLIRFHKILTVRLHYRSIYTGSAYFNLVQSNAHIYTVLTNTIETIQ